jgi:uncharacterized protein (TIGR00730 family)
MKRVCVFCGSSSGANPVYLDAARELGTLLAERALGLVYGGGNLGLMGALADAALADGGEVIGVIPESLVLCELAHRGCTKLRVVSSMHERKAIMADLADAFIALPGGFGTLDEFCEVLTWAQLGFHRKPCGLLNVAGFWDPFLAQLKHAVTEGFVRNAHLELISVETQPARLLLRLKEMKPTPPDKWIDRDRR